MKFWQGLYRLISKDTLQPDIGREKYETNRDFAGGTDLPAGGLSGMGAKRIQLGYCDPADGRCGLCAEEGKGNRADVSGSGRKERRMDELLQRHANRGAECDGKRHGRGSDGTGKSGTDGLYACGGFALRRECAAGDSLG